MKHLLWLLLGLSATSNAGTCEFFEKLSPYQIDVAEIAYNTGKPFDLGLTAVAVAWQESRLGLYKVRYNLDNIKDQSFGVMHTVAYWKTKGMSPFEAGRWVQSMVEDDVKSINVGVQDLIYWRGRAKGDWKRGVEMYNAGTGKNPVYVKDVTATVNKLKNCFN